MSTALRGLFYTIVLLLRNSTVIKRFANLLSAAQPILGKTASAIQPVVMVRIYLQRLLRSCRQRRYSH